jgi:hypothetical protein
MKLVVLLFSAVAVVVGFTRSVRTARDFQSFRLGRFGFDERAIVAATVVSAVGGTSNRTTVDLSQIGSAVVLLYNSKCGVCKMNITNWAVLRNDIASASPLTRVASLTVESKASDSAFWSSSAGSGLEHWILRDTGSFEQTFGTELVPTTAIIRDGVVVNTVTGVIGPRRRAEILRLLIGGPK